MNPEPITCGPEALQTRLPEMCVKDVDTADAAAKSKNKKATWTKLVHVPAPPPKMNP